MIDKRHTQLTKITSYFLNNHTHEYYNITITPLVIFQLVCVCLIFIRIIKLILIRNDFRPPQFDVPTIELFLALSNTQKYLIQSVDKETIVRNHHNSEGIKRCGCDKQPDWNRWCAFLLQYLVLRVKFWKLILCFYRTIDKDWFDLQKKHLNNAQIVKQKFIFFLKVVSGNLSTFKSTYLPATFLSCSWIHSLSASARASHLNIELSIYMN